MGLIANSKPLLACVLSKCAIAYKAQSKGKVSGFRSREQHHGTWGLYARPEFGRQPAINNYERSVSRHLRLTYLAPDVLRRLVYGREIPSITIREMTDLVTMSWEEQEKKVLGE